MSDFTVKEMLAMQQALQEKYKDKWEKISPETGKHKMLWMIGEIGEVIDVVKKNGDIKAVEDDELRKHLVEEMADILGTVSKIITMQKHEKPKGEWTSNVEYYYQR